ncbi:hypothetical protein AN639_11715 [Candidatus Epulonipiscium fishelsonii]|uniref:Uncharacterized protein n=1 Tax=Candidatus Epulonipiscium fishelsonii TaxID=77094 RepID=A0ACC8XD13_9FIRM|nr:hypothetical protein AN396_05270 [Epulopiscium sp. SCG-B11WGA-EpuloA1]ONI42937.1 hypothetical protein AN639_11715 [Epulopiscium sp. SCG-B05WGA-EpuloA1]
MITIQEGGKVDKDLFCTDIISVSLNEGENLHSFWIQILANCSGIGGGAKRELFTWMVENSVENIVIGTQRQMALAANVSLRTVNETFRTLMSVGLLKKINAGAYSFEYNVTKYKKSKNKEFNLLIKCN